MRICKVCPALFALFLIVAVSLPSLAATTFGPGTHLVGSEIKPGVYRTEGEITYFARLSGLTDQLSDIIANEASPPPPVLVEIKSTDVAFESKGPGQWTLVDGSYQPDIKTSFGPGWWFVGIDITPGLYRTEAYVRYFARLSGLGGELQDIIANAVPSQGPVVVEIKASDLAFRSKTDGIWTLIDDSYSPEIRNTFGDGYWIVNRDIMPGIYQTKDDVQYYARLSGFGNQLEDIIVNAASVTGGAVIKILDSDVGFLTKGGAQWSLIEIEETKNLLPGVLMLLLDDEE